MKLFLSHAWMLSCKMSLYASDEMHDCAGVDSALWALEDENHLIMRNMMTQ